MIRERIRRFVERVSPLALCDGCLVERLGDVPFDDVHLAVNELAVERGFDRVRATCSLCAQDRLAVRKVTSSTPLF